MPVTIIEQQMNAAGRVSLILRTLRFLKAGKWDMTYEAHPHDALEKKPNNFESTYMVQVARLEINDLPQEWHDREHWQPLYIKRNQSNSSKRLIYYWHGSGFISRVTPHHWTFLGRLSRELDADVILQTYTMVPFVGIDDVLPKITTLYRRVHDIARENKQELILGGDSAGGSISMAILQVAHENNIPLPDQALLIAPPMTLDIDNPENRAIEPNDPMLSIDRYLRILRGWATGPIDADTIYKKADPITQHEKTRLQSPYVAPINGDWTFLKTAGMPVTLVQGTYDILLPQVRQFVEKAKDLDLTLTYIEADRGCHVYPIMCEIPAASWLAPDAIVGLQLIVDSVLKYSKY